MTRTYSSANGYPRTTRRWSWVANWFCGPLCVAALVALVLQTGVSIGSSNVASRAEATIQQGLQRIVTIRQQQLQRYGQKMPGPPLTGNQFEPAVQLLEAQSRLAQAQGRSREAQDKLREIVAVRQQQYRSMAERSDLPSAAKDDVKQQVHEAELALAVATGNAGQTQKALDQIVELNKRRFDLLQRLQATGQQATAGETAEIRLLESQIQRAEFQLAAEQSNKQ